jgi:hypothetical protein
MSRIASAFVLIVLMAANAYAVDPPNRFFARLQPFDASGRPVDSNAVGRARVDVLNDGTALKFSVSVAGIENMVMAHIHVSPTPVAVTEDAGPVAVWFNGGPPPANSLKRVINGGLAAGYIISNGDLVSWDPVGDPLSGTIAGLVKAMREGRATVAVHTDDQDPNTPTGRQGDSRAGEIRGTLLP